MAVDQIDIAASGADGAVAARGNGVKLLVVAGFANGACASSPARPRRQDARGHQGKKVAVVRGGTQDLMLLAELEKNGLTWSERGQGRAARLLQHYADLNQALAQKYVDVICQSEPQSTQAISNGWGYEIVKPYDTRSACPTARWS